MNKAKIYIYEFHKIPTTVLFLEKTILVTKTDTDTARYKITYTKTLCNNTGMKDCTVGIIIDYDGSQQFQPFAAQTIPAMVTPMMTKNKLMITVLLREAL